MKTKFFLLVVLMVINMSAYAQENSVSKPKIDFYTEIYLGPGESNILSTGLAYKGFFLFGQVVEYENEYSFGVGALYDGNFKNTYYRIMGVFGKEFYGYVYLSQDFGIKYINPMPTLLYDVNMSGSVGIMFPFTLTKNISLGLWLTKEVVNKNGFELGENKLEIDLYFRF